MILCSGDALVDMVPVRLESGARAYRPMAGGSCLNIAVALARLGLEVGLVGGLSSDFLGDFLRESLATEGVDLSRATASDEETTLALVSDDVHAPRYVFYDQASAGRHWHPAPALDDLSGIEAVHFGSVTLIGEPAAGRHEAFAARARAAGCLVSLDPNCRPGLVRDAEGYRARIDRMARGSHLVRMSEEDAAYLHPGDAPEAVAAGYLGAGVGLVVVTRGAEGALAFSRAHALSVPAVPVAVADTIAAGDTFLAGLLAALAEAGRLSPAGLSDLPRDELAAALSFAARAAAITCSRPGADPPRRAEMQA